MAILKGPVYTLLMNTVLIVSSIALLFFLWNYKAIFSSKARSKRAKVTRTVDDDTNLMAGIVISEILALNRAAHVLTRSSKLLDKLLKMDGKEACEVLIRDYELSSVRVLVREEGHGHVIEEGFKKMNNAVGSSAVSSVNIGSEHSADHSAASSTNSTVSSTHHITSTSDHHDTSLRMALHCRNVLRPPMIGKVVKMVEGGEGGNDRKYIIELMK